MRTLSDVAVLEDLVGAFASDLERAVGLLRQLAIAAPDALVDRHPILGPMTRAQWMRWAFLHTDHHLRQVGL